MPGREVQGTFTWTTRAPAGPVRSSVQAGLSQRHRWLNADEATAYLGLPTRKALYAAVERGQVPAHRLGRRRLRFSRGELDALLGPVPESTRVR